MQDSLPLPESDAIVRALAWCGDPEAMVRAAVLTPMGEWQITLTGTFTPRSRPYGQLGGRTIGTTAVVTFNASRPDDWYRVEVDS